MKLEKAKKYLEVLTLNKEDITSRNGLPIYKFVILPIDYINKNNLTIDWYEVFENRNEFQKTFNNKWDYKIVGIIRPQYEVVSFDNNSTRFEEIAEGLSGKPIIE